MTAFDIIINFPHIRLRWRNANVVWRCDRTQIWCHQMIGEKNPLYYIVIWQSWADAIFICNMEIVCCVYHIDRHRCVMSLNAANANVSHSRQLSTAPIRLILVNSCSSRIEFKFKYLKIRSAINPRQTCPASVYSFVRGYTSWISVSRTFVANANFEWPVYVLYTTSMNVELVRH